MKGECNVTVSYNGENQTLPLVAVEKAGTSLFARDWIKAFQVDVNALLYHNTPTTFPSTIDCNVIGNCDRDLQRVLDQYPAVLSPGLGLCTKMKARLLLKELTTNWITPLVTNAGSRESAMLCCCACTLCVKFRPILKIMKLEAVFKVCHSRIQVHKTRDLLYGNVLL